MTAQIIPLAATPNQTLTVQLAGQQTRINIYQKGASLFVDVFVNDAPITQGRIARNSCKLIRDAYLGFIGDLPFFDTQGVDDPAYTGLGARWILAYLPPS